MDYDHHASDKYFRGKFKRNDGQEGSRDTTRKKKLLRKSPNFWRTRQNFPTKHRWEKARGIALPLYNDDGLIEDGRARIDCHDIDSEDEVRPPIFMRPRDKLIAFIENRTSAYGKKTIGCPVTEEMAT